MGIEALSDISRGGTSAFASGGGAGNVTVSDTPPASPAVDDVWVDTSGVGWQTPTLLNSFVGAAQVQFRRDGDIVFIRGGVSRVAVPSGVTIFVLPVGFRPLFGHTFLGTATTLDDFTRVVFLFQVNTSGEVQAVWQQSGPAGTAFDSEANYALNTSFLVS